MPHYRYNATNSEGKWVAGETDGSSLDEVEARLKSDGFRVESLIEAEAESAGRLKVASQDDLVVMVEHLATLTRAGLPLPSGLRAAGQEMVSANLRSTFLELADRLESGENLDEALKSSSRRFPVHLRGLILAGIRAGRLADLLSEYVRNVNLGVELRQLFWSNVTYPLVLLALVLGLVGFVCTLAMKAVTSLFGTLNDFGIQHSRNVEVVVALARFIADDWMEILGVMVATPLVLWLATRLLMNAAGRRRLLCSVPVLGPILKFTSMTEFCHLLAMLLEAELPLHTAFELAGASVKDSDVAEACERMGHAVKEGEPLWKAVRLWDSIPAGLAQLFRWSEAQRNLPESLHLAGDMFEARARSQAGFASNIVATFLLLMILWWLGFALAALFLPMISSISLLSKLSG